MQGCQRSGEGRELGVPEATPEEFPQDSLGLEESGAQI